MAGAGERGQVAPIVALVVVLAGALLVMLGRLGANAADQAGAQTAADAAALAGAIEGEEGARELAERNGAEMVSFVAQDDGVVVTVVVRRAEARARAVVSRSAVDGDCASATESWHPDAPAVTESPGSPPRRRGDNAGEVNAERSPGWARADVC
ncbi:MAG: hypothetical protein ACLGHT_10830, partial [Acidimicrobiia bacterium]